MSKPRQLLLLVGLLIVLAFLLARLVVGDEPAPAQSTAAPSKGTARPATRAGRVEAPVADVQLERLQAAHDGLDAADRNPFRFRPKPAPPPPPRPVQRPKPRPETLTPPTPAGPPPPPPIPLKYIGYIDTAGPGRIGYFRFADARGGTFGGREGETLEGRYRVLRLGPDSADLVYVDGRGRTTIRLSGQ